MNSTVTICGNDAVLLAMRRLLLERAGFSIQSALGLAGLADVNAEQLVLCHSLSKAEQMEAIRSVRSYSPDARVLVLAGDMNEPVGEPCETLPAFAAPLHLIEKVRQLGA